MVIIDHSHKVNFQNFTQFCCYNISANCCIIPNRKRLKLNNSINIEPIITLLLKAQMIKTDQVTQQEEGVKADQKDAKDDPASSAGTE